MVNKRRTITLLCRGLKSITDRGVCCYMISCKNSTNIDSLIDYLVKYSKSKSWRMTTFLILYIKFMRPLISPQLSSNLTDWESCHLYFFFPTLISYACIQTLYNSKSRFHDASWQTYDIYTAKVGKVKPKYGLLAILKQQLIRCHFSAPDSLCWEHMPIKCQCFFWQLCIDGFHSPMTLNSKGGAPAISIHILKSQQNQSFE